MGIPLYLILTDASFIRQQFSVVMQRTVLELQGLACIEVEHTLPDKKQIISSRSFGKPVTELHHLKEPLNLLSGGRWLNYVNSNCCVPVWALALKPTAL